MKKVIMVLWAILIAVLSFIASLPRKYIENAVKAKLFAPPSMRVYAAVSEGYVGFGATLTWNNVAIAEIVSDIPMPPVDTDMVDFFSQDSDDQYGEFKGGKHNPGELTLTCIFIPGNAGHQALITDNNANTLREVVITGPAAAAFTWTGNAIIKHIGGAIPINDKIGYEITIQMTGKWTYATTASTGMSSLTGIEENAGGALDLIPNFAIGSFIYNVAVNTASTWVKFTPTAGSHTITITCGTQSQTVVSGQQSTAITIEAADSHTEIKIRVQESGKTAKDYYIHVGRP